MEIRQITPFISVADQINEQDIATLVSSGFRTVINNRPDGEAADQAAANVLEAEARRQGLAYHFLPVVPGSITDENVGMMRELLASVQGPVLAFCRTGTRCTMLWALSESSHLTSEAIIAAAADAGYDLRELSERLNRGSRA